MTSSRAAAYRRMLVVFLLMSFAFSLILGVGASPAYAATHVGTTTYTSNVTWTLTNSPYVLDGDVTVAGGATLTIEPGVIVKLNGTLRSIWVSGTLQALGTSGAHITFTSLQDDAVGGDTGGDGTTSGSPGQWGAIKLQSATGAATFDHVDVRYGAYGSTPTSGGAIQTSNASESLTISHSTVRWSQSSGIYLFLGPATIDSTTISDGGNGVSINTAYAKIRNLSKITNNISDGVWVSLGAGTPAPTTVTNSDLTNNGRYGIYIIAGNQPLSLIPRGAMNNIYGNASKQLFISANPAFKNVELNWHYNYWGDVYYYFNDKSCLGTSPYSVGRIAYRSSTSSPPDGPMNGDTYLLLVNPPIVCAYDPFKNDPSTILAAPLHDGKPVTTLDETFGGCDGPGMADPAINASSCESDPVTGATGNFAKRETDLRLSGIGVPFQVTRTYNSLDPTVGPLGRGWSHSLSASLTIGSNGDVELHSDTGQGLFFTKQADGTFVANAGGRATLTSIQGGYELIDHREIHLRFDSAGRLTSIRDRNDKGLTLNYTGALITSVTDSANRTINFTYNGSNLLTQVTLADGRNVQYGYTNGLLTSVTDARGKVRTYTYDSRGLLTSETDSNNHRVFLNTYGSDGRVAEQVDALNRHTTFTWNPSTQTSTVTDARGKVWKDVYSNGVLVQQIDPLNNTTSYGYDTDLNLTSVTDARGKITSMTYDSRGNLLTRIAPTPLSYQETYTYDALNDVLTAQDRRGNTTTFAYDSAGNLTSVTRPGNNVTQFGRDPSGNGLLRSITDPRSKTTSLDYDSAGNLTAVTTPLGNKTTLSYDGSGRLTSTVEPRGNVTGADPNDYKTTYTYNANDALLSVTDPLGHSWTYAYDDGGNLTSATDPLTHAVSFAYNVVDLLASVTAPGGAVTTYSYDAVNDLASRTDANNHQTTYAYDDADRLSTVTNPLNKVWSFGYDEAGNRTVVTKPSGGTVTTSYDAINRPIGITFSDSTPSISYAYDGNSNRTQMVDGAGTQNYTYDNLDRLTALTRGADTFTYDYDAASNVTLRTYPDGTTISSSHDDDERLATVTHSGATVNYSYDAAALPTQITFPNGYIESRTYDRAARVVQIKHSSGASVLAQFDYAYDAAGNPTSATTPSDVTTYGYDNRDRLISACFQASCPGGSDPFIRWTYDPVGNRLTEVRPTGTTSYSYDAADELTQAGATTHSYDANGNEIAAGSRTFTWNLAAEMTSTTDANSTTTYTYDGDATRLSAASGAGTTGYLWDIHSETPLLAVERDGSGNPLRSYEYGLGIVGMVAGGQQYYFHRDAIGSIRGLTSASGQPEWTYSFEPFGSIRAETKIDPMAPDVTLRFAGQLSDPETGGYDLWQRMYDAETGRFASPDPLPTPVDQPYVSTYAYGENQPTVLTDPTGLGAVRAGDVCGTSFMCILGEHVAAAPGRCWRAINPLSSAATYLDVAKSIALHRFKGKAVKEAAKLGLKDWGYDLPWFTAGACINGIATGH